jgi:hypothetical protein
MKVAVVVPELPLWRNVTIEFWGATNTGERLMSLADAVAAAKAVFGGVSGAEAVVFHGAPLLPTVVVQPAGSATGRPPLGKRPRRRDPFRLSRSTVGYSARLRSWRETRRRTTATTGWSLI